MTYLPGDNPIGTWWEDRSGRPFEVIGVKSTPDYPDYWDMRTPTMGHGVWISISSTYVQSVWTEIPDRPPAGMNMHQNRVQIDHEQECPYDQTGYCICNRLARFAIRTCRTAQADGSVADWMSATHALDHIVQDLEHLEWIGRATTWS